MSNAIRYDAFLVLHLARELDREFAGRVVSAVQFDSIEQRVLIDVADIRLVWDLHPARGHVTRTAPLYPLPDSAILPKRARIASVAALENERVLALHFAGERRENATFTLIVELLANQWNAIALDHADKVLRVLKLRESGRVFRRGQNYAPPAHPEPERVPYRSPLNEHLTDEYFRRMLAEAPLPALVGDQPYPHHLFREDAIHFADLLSAFAAAAGSGSGEAVIAELERRAHTIGQKVERLREEEEKARQLAVRTRNHANVLMAYASTVTRGVSQVTLSDFEGNSLQIDLDARLTAMENADRLFNEARRQERALRRIPLLIAEASREYGRLEALLARARNGELSAADLKEIAARPPVAAQQRNVEKLPYRRYRTSGGLEVRVGRNAKANDELTLLHSSPRDIWLHARHAGGAHVVLRWHDADANPPVKDIAEAAALAAFHSAARTSGTVPVDYARRKYVRKPRKSPPGTVVMERAKTIFVEPSAELEQNLRA